LTLTGQPLPGQALFNPSEVLGADARHVQQQPAAGLPYLPIPLATENPMLYSPQQQPRATLEGVPSQ
jgi:hypothetical protein